MTTAQNDVVNHAGLMRELAKLLTLTIFEAQNAQQAEQRLTAKAAEAYDVVDILAGFAVDAPTQAEVGDVAKHLDVAAKAASERARTAQDTNTAAQNAARAIQRRHGGIAEAVAQAPVDMAKTPFYQKP